MSRSFRLPHLLCLFGLGACTSILGIEDLHEDARPGSSDGGDEATAGTSNNGAGKANNEGGKSGNGGTSNPQGGMAEPEAGAGNDPSGGSSGNTGGSSGNMSEGGGGEGGAPEPMRGKVTGKVVDRFGVPVGSVPVQVGESLVSTNDQGVFTIEDVPATYDVSLLVQGDGWVFQGLTRRDPTLQVFRGHPGHYTYVTVTSANATLGANDQLTLSAGMPTGTSDEYTDIGIDSSVSYSLEWDGGTSTASTVHGLEWTQDATTKLPVTYKAYDSKPLALMASVNAALSLDMMPKVISTGVVTGAVTPRVTPIGDGSRTNSVFVRFGSGASIQVVAHKAPAEAFSYVVPTLADSTITVAAWEGEYLGPLGMVHKDKLSPGAATGTLTIPAPPKLLKPLASSIDETTPFSFQGSPDNAGAFLVILNSLSTGSHLYIVTAQQKLSHLPSVVDGAWTLEHASVGAKPAEYQWWVETHGSFATVDAMTGPDGFIDEFSVNYDTPVGIHHRDGTYTYSSYSIVTTKNE
jgi:hypothetical protein